MSITQNKPVVISICVVVLALVVYILIPKSNKEVLPMQSLRCEKMAQKIATDLNGSGSVVMIGLPTTGMGLDYDTDEKLLRNAFTESGIKVLDTIWITNMKLLPEMPGLPVEALTSNLNGIEADAVISIFGAPSMGDFKKLKSLPPLYAYNVANNDTAKQLIDHGMIKAAMIHTGKTTPDGASAEESFDIEYDIIESK